jgi:hypothetical protein
VAFNLLTSPFVQLDVSMRATRAEIIKAQQKAVLDGDIEERDLDRMLATLTAPRDRLRAEVAFLPGKTPAQARSIIAKLKGPDDGSDCGDGWDGVNVIAHLIGNGGDIGRSLALLQKGDADHAPAVTADINAARQVSGFGNVTEAAVRDAINTQLAEYADVLAERLAANESGRALAATIVEVCIGEIGSRVMLAAFVQAYSRRTAPLLRSLTEQIEAQAEALRSTAKLSDANILAASIGTWDAVRQPVQNWDEAHGIDEPETKQLGDMIRDLCISLANERGAYNAALIVSRALHDAFGELAGMRDVFAKDVDTLEELAEEARLEQACEPLVAMMNKVRANPTNAKSLVAAGIAKPSGGARPENWTPVYEAALDACSAGGNSDVPTIIIRNLALELHNEHSETSAAQAITSWLIAYKEKMSPDLFARILSDQHTLIRMQNENELQRLIEAKEFKKAVTLIDRMLDNTNDSGERSTLYSVRKSLEDRIQGQGSNVGWWVTGIIAFIVIVANVDRKSSTNNSYDYNPSATTSSEFDDSLSTTEAAPAEDATAADAMAPAADAAAVDPAATAAENVVDATEVKPDPGYSQSFSISSLRYCLRQKERLNAAETAVSNTSSSEIDGFNAAVEDFNNRCGSFRYLPSDMTVVNEEIATDGIKLREEGRLLVESWH